MFPPKVATFFNLRGINAETLKRFGVKWNGKEIVIPIKDKDGKVLFNKYRRDPESNEGPKYRNESGSKVSLFNYNPKAEKIIIVEGELDAMRLWALGYDACSSTGGSQAFKKEWIPLFKYKDVFICYDNDKAGIQGAVKLGNMFPDIVRLVPFPTYFTGKDVTDFLQYHTQSEFTQLLNNGIPCMQSTDENLQDDIDTLAEYRRTLKSNDLSSELLEEQLRILNDRKVALKKKKKKIMMSNEIDNIKDVPITNLIEFNPAGFSNCIWHTEKSPSMKYYPKTNSVYCFGCGASGDSIAVVRQLEQCTFLEAIEKLKKHL